MLLKTTLTLFAVILSLGLVSCAVQKERKVVLPKSSASVSPWNRTLEGEGQGQFGAFQR